MAAHSFKYYSLSVFAVCLRRKPARIYLNLRLWRQPYRPLVSSNKNPLKDSRLFETKPVLLLKASHDLLIKWSFQVTAVARNSLYL